MPKDSGIEKGLTRNFFSLVENFMVIFFILIYQAIGLGFLYGCTSQALTGHAVSQLKHVQQSFAKIILAFSFLSITITVPGHIVAQIPHPIQAAPSILRIIISLLHQKNVSEGVFLLYNCLNKELVSLLAIYIL